MNTPPKKLRPALAYASVVALLAACGPARDTTTSTYTAAAVTSSTTPAPDRARLPASAPSPAPGTSIERLDPAMDALIAPGAELEQIASGYEWAEGVEWVGDVDDGYLIWSDVRANKAYRWDEAGGARVYLEPSGYTGAYFAGEEPGSNRLFVSPDGELMLCQHGDRRIARMTAPMSAPRPEFATVVGFYNGKRLNSPNDVDWYRNGDLYFTDPAYGLPGGQHESSVKELDFQGVYRFSFRDSATTLLTSELSRPNGIAFTPDYASLLVANSDAQRPIWMKYPVEADGTLGEGAVFFDASPMVPGPQDGIPDGMAMHSSGTLFATGPGGVLVIDGGGKHIGTLKTGQTTANCAFNPDESVLYITADSLIMRVPMLAGSSVPAERR